MMGLNEREIVWKPKSHDLMIVVPVGACVLIRLKNKIKKCSTEKKKLLVLEKK